MKKFLMIGAACATAMASPAFAQSATGTINITGTVAGRCAVVNLAGAPATYNPTINLGELSQTDGTLKPSTDLAAAFVAGGTPAFRVLCNSLAPTITVDANPLVNGAGGPAGYETTVNFRANVTVQRATGGPAGPFTNLTTAGVTGPTAIGGALAPTGNNISVTADTFSTPGGGQMSVGTYNGNIVVTISPA